MFTGIIEALGKVTEISPQSLTLSIPPLFQNQLALGNSISVNGTCLTITSLTAKDFSIDVMPETRRKTMLSTLRSGDYLNLERALPAKGRLDGHLVQGHVDGIGSIRTLVEEGNSRIITLEIPPELSRFIAPKGSIALNGVSLTIISVTDTQCQVGIIPHTWEHTTFQFLHPGDPLNIETDVIAKYLARLIPKS